MPQLFLGIDCGTQGTKALIVDEEGRALGRGYCAHDLIERDNGAREQQPQWWVDAMIAAVRQATAGLEANGTDTSRIVALSVSGQQHGLVVLDEKFEVIRPAKLWNDTETAAENEAMIARLGGREEWFARFGIVPLTGYTVSKLLWLKLHEPENFARVRHILLPHDYLNFWLTGKLSAEFGDASGTGFFDVRKRAWSAEVLAAISGEAEELSAALPPLIDAKTSVGTLRRESAAQLGLAATCLVACGGGDNMMGAIGTGNVREGVVTLSLGTSSTVYSYREHAPSDSSGCVAPFCSSTGGWLPLVCTMNATNVVTGVVEMLGKTVADIEDALASTPPGADGLVMLPFLNGERTPDLPRATGSMHGMTPSNLTAAHMIRAAVEGVSFGVLEGLSLIVPEASPQEIVVIGGGAKSRAWRQLLADTTGARIRVPAEAESGCLGAAIQAMYMFSHVDGDKPVTFVEIADRCVHMLDPQTVEPDAALRDEYQRARARYRQTLQAVHPLAGV